MCILGSSDQTGTWNWDNMVFVTSILVFFCNKVVQKRLPVQATKDLRSRTFVSIWQSPIILSDVLWPSFENAKDKTNLFGKYAMRLVLRLIIMSIFYAIVESVETLNIFVDGTTLSHLLMMWVWQSEYSFSDFWKHRPCRMYTGECRA